MSRRAIIGGDKPKAVATHKCKNCGRRLQPQFEIEWTPDAQYTGQINGYGYLATGDFCALACGFRYGLRAARAGVTFKELDVARVPAKRGKKAGPDDL